MEVRVEGDPVAVVDPFHLRQMVANLVSNALRYGALPVVVTVAADGSVFLEVLDHGTGVPEDFVPHLFERFTRAQSSRRPPPVGKRLRALHRAPARRGQRLPGHLLGGRTTGLALPPGGAGRPARPSTGTVVGAAGIEPATTSL